MMYRNAVSATVAELQHIAKGFSINKATSCWEWRKSISPKGYANVVLRKRSYGGHRLMYRIMRGTIPEGLVCDHLCRNRSCINPYHLEAVTQKENVNRGDTAVYIKGGNCINGHKLTETNIYVRPSSGRRECIICKKTHRKRQYQKFKQSKLMRNSYV